MPIVRPVTRHLAAACLAVAALLAVAAGPASALEPPRPLPGYHPRFVTETDEHPWTDCLWASAAMLLDKWTNGDETRTHNQLRALSGDRTGGSTFKDLAVAFRKVGFSTPSNLAGSRLSWHELLKRLRNGAGAIVLGDYGDLPRWYGRWDYGFWKGGPLDKHAAKAAKEKAHDEGKGKGKGKVKIKMKADNHAVYVERYDPRHRRVWLMDPLARGDWHGEWISVRSLMRFAWSSGGRVFAVVTPTAAPAPFSGVRLRDPEVDLSDAAVTASWGVQAPGGWRWPGVDVHVAIARAAAPLEAAARSALVAPGVSTVSAPVVPVAGLAGHELRVSAALPAAPGAYTAAVSLTDRRFGRGVAASAPVAVFVPGEQRATMRLNVVRDVLTEGGDVRVNLSVANRGTVTWADGTQPDGDTAGATPRTARQLDTRVTAHWIRLDAPAPGAPAAGDDTGGTGASGHRGDEAVTLLRVPLDPGKLTRFRGKLVVPSEAGTWALVVDVEDSIVGSFASLGSAPAVAVFQVVPPRGIEALD
jgi:hypothetical protein